ncbi:hypothetical protein DPMN_159727 [Dreissena polymorpha]|uniref:Uncharacterized protein n=1 Tax=Dreissena polymorpha TaxID=45954 RepID=A0A9D4IPF1_DREPO|nr:hypothetical protein DPMN_159727 [Dreissena polymorpha]
MSLPHSSTTKHQVLMKCTTADPPHCRIQIKDKAGRMAKLGGRRLAGEQSWSRSNKHHRQEPVQNSRRLATYNHQSRLDYVIIFRLCTRNNRHRRFHHVAAPESSCG